MNWTFLFTKPLMESMKKNYLLSFKSYLILNMENMDILTIWR